MKNKFSPGKLALLGLFLVLAPAAMAATTWYVNGVNGSDKNDCKTPQTACKTIKHAISLTSSGDSIMVAAATYKETLTINSSLKIFGAGAATTIIDGYQGVFIQQDNAIVTLSGLTIRNGLAGINNSGKLTLDDSTISGGAGGGGIANYGTMTVNRCTIRGNVGAGFDGYYSAGGGVYNSGVLTINSSTISENDAEGNYVCGGGIYNSGTLAVNNATLNRNHARGDSNSVGGGIENDGGMVVLSNSTLEGNSAVIHEYGDGSAGGIDNGGCVMSRSYASTTTLQNTIVANNAHGGNCSGTMTSMGYNLSSDKTCKFDGPGDLNDTVPKLGKLGNYGGLTETIPLLAGSPAGDAGNPSGCTDGRGRLLKTDQRGKPRPGKYKQDQRCDIGAYERQHD